VFLEFGFAILEHSI